MQILRYEHGQKYEPHFDYFHDKINQVRGGHRYATVLMYLSTVHKGGETVFPNAMVLCCSYTPCSWRVLYQLSVPLWWYWYTTDTASTN